LLSQANVVAKNCQYRRRIAAEIRLEEGI